ncbi:hypothetical protein [Pseudomonas sp. EA_65y_Pfl2_P78]|uniref:hypothetical protein n=1 Tax=Pseudomonas sp. EA_65y_Pfl2_P78 TaxID=3088695 RepID=UPI0030D98E20
MKVRYLLLALLLPLYTCAVNAAWKCNDTYLSATPASCKTAGTQETPEAFLQAYVAAEVAANTNPNKQWKAKACSTTSASTAICNFDLILYTTNVVSNSVGLQKEAAVCPETLESRGPDSAAVKSGDKYYVAWSIGSITNDICHSACSYLASSATTSTCYLTSGSTTSGFCNYVVGLNTQRPACVAEYGYSAPKVGDPLTPSTNPGDGSDGGSDGGSGGNDGGTGGNGSGGNGDGTFDGELSFSSPGALDAQSVIGKESNAAAYDALITGMQADLNESDIGTAVNEFTQKMSSMSTVSTCPTSTVQILGTTIVLDVHCILFNSISPTLNIVFLACWSLLALRVFLSA